MIKKIFITTFGFMLFTSSAFAECLATSTSGICEAVQINSLISDNEGAIFIETSDAQGQLNRLCPGKKKYIKLMGNHPQKNQYYQALKKATKDRSKLDMTLLKGADGHCVLNSLVQGQ